jgi:triosephosphate isomerase (TIM)
LGAQDCYTETSGAFTGAVSTNLLKDMGVGYVLVGHSERRTIFKEDDTVINHKVKKVLKDGLKPVLCIGESKAEYEAGLNQEICGIQLMKGLQDVSAEDMLNVVVACKILLSYITYLLSVTVIA